MNDSEQRTLQCYLTSVLEPMLKHATAEAAKWKATEDKEKAAQNSMHRSYEHDLAIKMNRYHQGKVEAYTYAIDEFKSMFAEELAIDCCEVADHE